MKKSKLIVLILLIIIVGISFQSKAQSSLVDTKIDFNQIFSDYQGGFILYDLDNNEYLTYNEKQVEERLSPCSTFKIFNSLVVLETGVVEDKNRLIKWDGTKYPVKSWNQDHTLETAISNSVVWYYQQVAREIGRDRMKKYLEKVDYGNKKIGPRIDTFWLDNSLQISAIEQVKFLTRLYEGELPFTKRTIKVVKDIITLEEKDNITLAGKTGSNGKLGWFVGYIYNNDYAYTFAVNIKAKKGAYGWKAKLKAKQILKKLDLLK